MHATRFEELWCSPDFQLETPEKQEESCIYARRFAEVIEPLCRDAIANPDHISINQAMLLLLKKYFEWRSSVPRNHRNRMSEQGHVCLFHIFERAYQHLKILELSLAPPMLYLPQPPPAPLPPPPPPQIAGITLGELVDEE